MKQCPACRTTYTDDSLSFCLADGNTLVTVADDEPTVVRSRGNSRQHAVNALQPDEATNEPRQSSALWLKLLIGALVLGIAAIAAIGLLGAVFYYNTGSGPTPTPVRPTPLPVASTTPDPEKERLRSEIANIQRQLDKKTTERTPNTDDDPGSAITAAVNSPGDGFLALRDRPDVEGGRRLAKIPHEARVNLVNCEKEAVTVAGRSGRWCQVEYNGMNGYVFDAWLKY